MTAVTLAVTAEQEWLGFDESPVVGETVKATYDFGCGPVVVIGTFERVEMRATGERFVWVREADGTRYAIPDRMIETLRSTIPVMAAQAVTVPVKTRHNLHESHHGIAAHGRACARLDYEGLVGF